MSDEIEKPEEQEQEIPMSEDAKAVLEDVGRFKSIGALKDSEGGKLLVGTLEQDVVSGVERIVGSYRESSHIELIAIIAKLQSDLSLLRVLTRAETNQKDAEDALKTLLGK